jgi:hypothetical protein
MKRSYFVIGAVVLIGIVTITVLAVVDAGRISQRLIGYEEVPAVSTGASAQFNATIVNSIGFPGITTPTPTEIQWEMSYTALEGNVLQSHIHFGQKSVNGGIVVFLCSNLGNGPAGTQPCPQGPATIRGTFRPQDVTGGANAQGIAPGQWDEFIAAMRAGVTYVNIHSSTWTGGEIRSQIHIMDQ